MTKSPIDTNFQTQNDLFRFIMDNMKNLTFGKNGDVGYSRKHGGYIYSGDSSIEGMKYSTSWSHQKDKFEIVFNLNIPEANTIHQNILKIKNTLKDNNIDVWPTSDNIAYVTFTQNNIYTNRLMEEFIDGVTGYSQEDL